MRTVANADVTIAYEVVGSGFPVVLHTGAGGDHTMWEGAGYVAGLTGFQCILIDHRGHGASSRPPELAAHALEHYVADVLAVLDALAVQRVAFWGYSDGMLVGYALAAQAPARVGALIASGGIAPPDPVQRGEAQGQRAAAGAHYRARGMRALVEEIEAEEGLRLPDWLRANLLATDAEMFALELEAWAPTADPWSVLPDLRAPVLLVAGQHEDNGELSQAAARLPAARTLILPGLGHVGAFLCSEQVLPQARAFLQQVGYDAAAGEPVGV